MTLAEMIGKSGASRPATATAATPATQAGKSSPVVGSIQVTPSLPPALDRYCLKCGGGSWIRPTSEAPYQCGRCIQSETHPEILDVPGGTAPPKAQSDTVKEWASPIVEPAAKPDGSPLSPIYWETGDGRILGPAVPEYLARDRNTFWIVVTFSGQIRWIDADRLRSKKAFNAQSPFSGRAQLGHEINDMKGSHRTS